MKAKKPFVVVISLIFALSITSLASANGGGDPVQVPKCGTYTDIRTGPGDYGSYTAEWYVPGVSILIQSYDGWTFVKGAWLDWDKDPIVSYTAFAGSTSEIVPLPPGGAAYSSVTLHKACACHPTGKYVYTLLGNYPCNLVTTEDTIPARFLNPDYTGPLCNLPELDHVWNGDWVRNEELDCGGYLVGGNHYDTSQGTLP